ncbi:hypothetical protein ABL78_6570 [Leptomonas seymouri]|uniref:Opioid growth factor receptor (OGFr) conserved domain-containing protein n=1 Tax=Leptomonas seymouri TaxID=5684 RepID=A0A0N1I0M4_LEPSE|nr:hypothetical protein ABL78_6570 [Leptomonas seymouri]|eukprot:KPI84363.1 hypothetical protein ABL78_6570 [Leptomonas seymouri]
MCARRQWQTPQHHKETAALSCAFMATPESRVFTLYYCFPSGCVGSAPPFFSLKTSCTEALQRLTSSKQDADGIMEYKLLANPRIRQEAQRCLRSYHGAYRLRRQTSSTSTRPAPSSSFSSTTPSPQQGSGWRFYNGELPASPGREYVDDLLAYGGENSSGYVSKHWCPEELERRHDYIQWLFPLRGRGVNWLAPLLTTSEAIEMQQDGLIMARVLQAFRMMLRFYGAGITYTTPSASPSECPQESSGPASMQGSQQVCIEAQIRRTSNRTEWAAQYDNLVHRPHNYLRISRILQFLGEVGLEPLKLGWLQYLAQEVFSGVSPASAPLAACRDSFFFWMEIPFEEMDRVRLQRHVEMLVSCSAPPVPATGPVVVVKGLLLPSTLDLSRVLPIERSSDHAGPTSPLPALDRKGAKKRERQCT